MSAMPPKPRLEEATAMVDVPRRERKRVAVIGGGFCRDRGGARAAAQMPRRSGPKSYVRSNWPAPTSREARLSTAINRSARAASTGERSGLIVLTSRLDWGWWLGCFTGAGDDIGPDRTHLRGGLELVE